VPDEHLWAQADATRITQLVGNLLHNASKFTGRGDSVVLSIEAMAGEAEIRLRDTRRRTSAHSGGGDAGESHQLVAAVSLGTFGRCCLPGLERQSLRNSGFHTCSRPEELASVAIAHEAVLHEAAVFRATHLEAARSRVRRSVGSVKSG